MARAAHSSAMEMVERSGNEILADMEIFGRVGVLRDPERLPTGLRDIRR